MDSGIVKIGHGLYSRPGLFRKVVAVVILSVFVINYIVLDHWNDEREEGTPANIHTGGTFNSSLPIPVYEKTYFRGDIDSLVISPFQESEVYLSLPSQMELLDAGLMLGGTPPARFQETGISGIYDAVPLGMDPDGIPGLAAVRNENSSVVIETGTFVEGRFNVTCRTRIENRTYDIGDVDDFDLDAVDLDADGLPELLLAVHGENTMLYVYDAVHDAPGGVRQDERRHDFDLANATVYGDGADLFSTEMIVHDLDRDGFPELVFTGVKETGWQSKRYSAFVLWNSWGFLDFPDDHNLEIPLPAGPDGAFSPFVAGRPAGAAPVLFSANGYEARVTSVGQNFTGPTTLFIPSFAASVDPSGDNVILTPLSIPDAAGSHDGIDMSDSGVLPPSMVHGLSDLSGMDDPESVWEGSLWKGSVGDGAGLLQEFPVLPDMDRFRESPDYPRGVVAIPSDPQARGNPDGMLDYFILVDYNDTGWHNETHGINGTMFFQKAGSFSVEELANMSRVDYLGLHDLDGDYIDDLVIQGVKETGDGAIYIVLNHEHGPSVRADSTIPLGSVEPLKLVMEDADADGDLDMMILSGTGLGIFFNDGAGTFMPDFSYDSHVQEFHFSPVAFEAARFNKDPHGDDLVDLAFLDHTGETVRVYINDHGYCVHTHNIEVGLKPEAMAVVDIDGDQDMDIVTADVGYSDGNDRFSVAENINGAFPSMYIVPNVVDDISHMDHGDFDGDGDQDLVVSFKKPGPPYNHLGFYRNDDGRGDFVLQKEIVLDESRSLSLQGLEVMDYDGDGDDDVLYWTRGHPARVGWAGNRGGWNFSLDSMSITADDVFFYDLGFLNVSGKGVLYYELAGDGYPEIIILKGDTPVVYPNINGSFVNYPMSFNLGSVIDSVEEVMDLLAADVNADGHPDLVMVLKRTDGIHLMITLLSGPNPGDTGLPGETALFLRSELPFQGTPDFHHLLAMDLERDGDMDVVAVDSTAPSRTITRYVRRSTGSPVSLKVYGGVESRRTIFFRSGIFQGEEELDFSDSVRAYLNDTLPVGPVTRYPLVFACNNDDGAVELTGLKVRYRVPELFVTDLSFGRAEEGKGLEITAEVANAGSAAHGVGLVFYDNGERIGELTIPEVPALGTVSASMEWDIPFFEGAGKGHNISAELDPGNMITESDEDNNRAYGEIYLRTSTAVRGTFFTLLECLVFFATLWTVREYSGYVNRKNYNLTGDSIWMAEEAMKFSRRHGIEPPPEVRLLYRRARLALRSQQFAEAAETVKDLKVVLRSTMEAAYPDIRVDLTSLRQMTYGRWNHMEIVVSNMGNTHASEVELVFHSGMPVKGRLHRMRLDRGKRKRVLVGFMPFRPGEFAVDVDISYKRAFDGAVHYGRVREMVHCE